MPKKKENPIIVSEICQKFLGKEYKLYKGSKYFSRNNCKDRTKDRLHKVVWEHHNGSIPEGHAVHHFDEDRSNNHVSNLRIHEKSIHQAIHMRDAGRKEIARQALKKYAQPKAAEWHGSEEGKAWHKEHAKQQTWERKFTKVCNYCGKEYKAAMRKKSPGYCSGKCKAAQLRSVQRETMPERTCRICGKAFRENPSYVYQKKVQKFCSQKCYGKSRASN